MKKISGLALIIIGLLHSVIALLIPGTLGFNGILQEIADIQFRCRLMLLGKNLVNKGKFIFDNPSEIAL